MTLLDAESICASQGAQEAWDYISAHPQSFIWSDDEEPVSTWNALFAENLGRAAVRPLPDRDGAVQFSFRDRTVDVQSKSNREDRFRDLHGLARAVRPESDLRLCRDSTHSSDVAFLAMTPLEWIGLETKFGPDRVNARFLPMDAPFDDFMRAAFSVPEVPRGTPTADLTDWDGGNSYRPGKLEYTLVCDGPGRPRVEALRRILQRYLEAGTVTVSFWRTPSTLTIDRDVLAQAVGDRIGRLQIRVSNLSCTGFVVIEPNGVAAGWRTDTWRPPEEAHVPWWRFWNRREKSD
jgi:hypothetical protein